MATVLHAFVQEWFATGMDQGQFQYFALFPGRQYLLSTSQSVSSGASSMESFPKSLGYEFSSSGGGLAAPTAA